MRTVDIIILSYAKHDALKKVTEKGIETLLNSENPENVIFNILVLESEKTLQPYQYPGTQTLYPDVKFNFNKYLNIGLRNTTNEYICFCNNDLIYHPLWASNILQTFDSDHTLMSASPICSIFHPSIGIPPDTGTFYGHEIRNQIAGWCIFTKRELFNSIGLFDENFRFWFSDADYAQLLKKNNHKHALVTTSIVDHLDGVSTAELDLKMKQAVTSEQYWYYQYKWEHKNYLLYLYRRLRSKMRLLN